MEKKEVYKIKMGNLVLSTAAFFKIDAMKTNTGLPSADLIQFHRWDPRLIPQVGS